MGFVSRGFRGRRRRRWTGGPCAARPVPDRDFPVLSAGPTPTVRLETGASRSPARWTSPYVDLGGVPRPADRAGHASTSTASPSGRSSTRTGRGSRSTRCSRGVETAAEHVLAHCYGGYTTNLPLEDLIGGKAWSPTRTTASRSTRSTAGRPAYSSRTSTSGRAPSGCAGCELIATDEPGFWEPLWLPQLRRPMAGATVRGRLSGGCAWRVAGSPGGRRRETPTRRARLVSTSPAGPGICRASTSTSASPPRTATRPSAATRSPRRRTATRLALTVERLEDGEVSPYLTDELQVGDRFELRGPIGGYFVWSRARGRAAAAGGGRLGRRAADGHAPPPRGGRRARCPARLLLSSRSWQDVIYRDELARLAAATRAASRWSTP